MGAFLCGALKIAVNNEFDSLLTGLKYNIN